MTSIKPLFMLPAALTLLILSACEDPGKAVSSGEDATRAPTVSTPSVAEPASRAPDSGSEVAETAESTPAPVPETVASVDPVAEPDAESTTAAGSVVTPSTESAPDTGSDAMVKTEPEPEMPPKSEEPADAGTVAASAEPSATDTDTGEKSEVDSGAGVEPEVEATPPSAAAEEETSATQLPRPTGPAAFADRLIEHAQQVGWLIAFDDQDNIYLFPPGTLAARLPY